jgi:hypothetical protein
VLQKFQTGALPSLLAVWTSADAAQQQKDNVPAETGLMNPAALLL